MTALNFYELLLGLEEPRDFQPQSAGVKRPVWLEYDGQLTPQKANLKLGAAIAKSVDQVFWEMKIANQQSEDLKQKVDRATENLLAGRGNVGPNSPSTDEYIQDLQSQLFDLDAAIKKGNQLIDEIVSWCTENHATLGLVVDCGKSTRTGLTGLAIRKQDWRPMDSAERVLLAVYNRREFIAKVRNES